MESLEVVQKMEGEKTETEGVGSGQEAILEEREGSLEMRKSEVRNRHSRFRTRNNDIECCLVLRLRSNHWTGGRGMDRKSRKVRQ